MHKINVEITFFNPFRVVPWRKRGERDADPLYSRGGGFARWHMKKEETGLGRPYITGTLVRSALYAEVEKLLVLEKPARHFGCCDGVDKTPGERKPHFLRKRPRFGEERETEPCGTCPLCRLLGRGDAHRGPDKFKDQRYENGTVHFENFWESGDRRFFWKDVAQRRVLNRVDHSCGKAKDYYDIREIDPANCARFSGRVRINEANLTGEELAKVRELMALGLAQVNILAGAICRVDMVSESHDDAIRRFWRHDEEAPPPDVRPGDAPEIYEMGGLDKLARIMATAFEESQRRAFLRRLADAVRDLRRHGPDFLDHLPEGKTDDRPSVWNKTTDQGYTLLELLQMQARHIGDGPWRQFCENLGMALYREQKNLENRAESKPRLLGETRLHGLPMRRDKEKRYETPFQSKKSFPAVRWLIAGELTAVTPFFLGAESDVAHAGGCVLLSRDRSFRLPRSAVRGALRRDLGLLMGDACNARVGGEICTCGACRTMRNVVIEDAVADFRKPPEVRHRIRLNCHTGVVEEGALFDMETGLQGLTFPFRMHYASIEPMLPDHLWRVLEYWREKRAFIGGAIGTGFGRFQLTLSKLYLWDLTEEEDCAQYQLARGFKGFSMDALKKLTPAPADLAWKNAREESSAPPDPMPWKKIAYTITMTSPLLSRDPIAAMFHPDAPDAVMVHKTVVSRDKEGRIRETPRPLVKSESIRGALRAIVSRNKVVVERPPGEAAPVGEEKTRSLFDLDHEDCDCIQCRLFGSVHQQGRLRFEDAEVQGKAPARKMDHVAIDRYTGGGVDRLKFDDYPLTPGEGGALTLKGVFWIRGALSDEERTALTSALSEIKSGLISLGGLGAIGYGRVKTFEITRGADILDPPEWRFHPVPGAGRVSMKPPPGPGIAPGKIYHPHYFIPPAPRLVEREASPASHAMDADHEGAPLFSGKLACTLTTRGPIFIPDAANDDYFNMNGEKAGGKEEHKNYGFFRYNGKPAIPGASIRGMISSVYETLTHSCYRVMDAKKYITRRVRPESEGAKTGKKGRVRDADADVDLEPGRVIKRGDKWVVAPMGESVRLPLYDVKNVIDGVKAHKYRGNGRFYKQKLNAAIQYNHLLADAAAQNRAFLRGMDWEQRIAVLEGREPIYFEVRRQERRLKSGRQKEVNPNARFGVLTSSTQNTQRGYIKYTGPDMVNVNKIPKTNSPFKKAWEEWNPFDVDALPLHNEIEARPSQRQEYPRPVLACVRNKVEYRMYKRCERVFTEPAAGAAELPIPETVVKQFRDILEDNGDNTEKIPDVFKSRLQKTGLRDSELVYYKLDKAKGRVTSLAPVCISREVDRKPLGKRFPDIEINGQRKPNDSLQPCTHTCLEDCEDCPSLCEKVKDYFHPHPDGLCPACHLFGTPYYRGRVGFGFARLAGAAPRWCVPPEKDGPGGGPLTLPLLERPRPTWSMPEGDSRIPGRKYYVHHPWSVERIKRRRPGSGVEDEIPITPNNRTVEPLAKENAFTFSVTFHNLRAWELGLLVYSLELEDGLAHKLGMAKSMGLGSVRIEATNLQLKHAPASEMDKHTLIREGFKKLGLSDLQTTDFTGLTHIKQLREMLWLPEDETNALVRYPELESKDKTIPGYVDMVRKQIPESGANNPKYLEPRVRLGILQTPWRPWHSRG